MRHRRPSPGAALLASAALLAMAAAGCSRFEPLAASDAGSGFEVQDPLDVAATDDADTSSGPAADASEATAGPDVLPGDAPDGGPPGDTAPADAQGDDAAGDDAAGDAGQDGQTPGGDDAAPGSGDAGPGPDGDSTSDGGPGADTDADDIGPCQDECPEEGLNRCAEGATAALERCLPAPDTGCLVWTPHADCGEPADLCAGVYECVDGACLIAAGSAVVCDSPNPDPCVKTACNPATGICEESPIPVFGSCDDGNPCTVLEKCNSMGDCVGGLPDAVSCPCSDDEDCVAFDEDGDACNGRFLCGKQLSACEWVPEPIVCSPSGLDCAEALCEAATGECVLSPVADGSACDDEDACSDTSSCLAGSCAGDDWHVCLAGTCEASECNPDTGACEVEVLDGCCGNGIPEGAEQCDDGDPEAPGCTDTCLLVGCEPRSIALGDGCLLVAGEGLLPVVENLTLEFFVRPTAVSQEATLFDREATAGPGDLDWRVGIAVQDGQLRLTWHEGRIEQFDVSIVGPSLAVGQWQHVAIVRKLTPPGGLVTFFIDGVPAASQSVDVMLDLGGSEDLWIGCRDGFSDHFAGNLDELAVHGKAKYTGSFLPPALPLFVDETTELLMHFDHTAPGVSVDATGGGRDGYWQGVSGSSSNAFEDSAFGPSPSCDASWCRRSALAFAPGDEAVAVSAEAPIALDDVQSLTVEAWLRVDIKPGPGEEPWILGTSEGGPGGQDWHIVAYSTPTGQIRLKWIEGQVPGLFDNFVSSVGALIPGESTHVAVVRAFAGTGEASIRWFINGTAESATPLSGALPLLPTPSLYVGSNAGTSSFLAGFIDDLRISEGVLYQGSFTPTAQLSPRWDTLGLYRCDAKTGVWTYPEAPSTLPPLVLEAVQWAPSGLTGAPPCPP